jgi:hypothetical protein
MQTPKDLGAADSNPHVAIIRPDNTRAGTAAGCRTPAVLRDWLLQKRMVQIRGKGRDGKGDVVKQVEWVGGSEKNPKNNGDPL